jgi:hypothetical protein
VPPIAKPLAELAIEAFNAPLDSQNNRLMIQRAPGDDIRVRTDRDSLVFSTAEKWAIDVVPHRIGYPPESPIRFEAELVPARGTDALWRTSRELKSDAEGNVPPVPGLEIPLPDVEGVYDLVLALRPGGLRNRFIPARWAVTRSLQFVVIDPEPPSEEEEVSSWRAVVEFDPAQPRWWERMPRLPQWRLVPGVGPGALGNKKTSITTHEGRPLTQLAPGGWQVYPLPIDQTDMPHFLEVEYAGDLSQTLGISIIEPNSAGVVTPIGLDSGVDVSEAMARGMFWHRLVFWPRTKTPYVVLTNRRSSGMAAFGTIRVMAGPKQLAPVTSQAPIDGVRMPLAHFDRPVFPEIFSARDALDPVLGRSLDDWLTFYDGGKRMTEYLHHVGYAGASISVYCEGSTIYPSRLVDPTPKYDTGIYFTSGQDLMRKDVLEMMFRIFDRAGLQLIPAVQFTAPLPALERIVERGAPHHEGVLRVDVKGRSGGEQAGPSGGVAADYNPLDERVQSAMKAVIGELVERYGHHRSFAGISLDLAPDSYALLPGAPWGADPVTLGHFRRDTAGQSPKGQGASSAPKDRPLAPSEREAWLDWRADKMLQLYRSLGEEVAKSRPKARLFLAGSDLPEAPPIHHVMRPALPRRKTVREVMRELGIDVERYRGEPGIVLLRPQRLWPREDMVRQAVTLEFNELEEVDRLFGSGAARGSLFYHETQPLRLTALDAISPFGPDKTTTWLAPRFSPAGAANRRRFIRSLVSLDAQWMFDGGWTVAMGQEDALRDLVDTYRRLPVESFQPPSGQETSAQPVIVRTLAKDQETYIYVVNDSAWPVSAEIEIAVPDHCGLRPLSYRRPLPPLVRDQSRARWVVSLQPYDLIAGVLTSPHAAVRGCSVQLPPHVVPALEAQVAEAGASLTRLKNPPPLDVLKNPSFDGSPSSSSIAGWDIAQGPSISTCIDSADPHSGSGSLRVESSAPVARVRSHAFPPPRTGRLSLQLWLRGSDSASAPKLRLVVEGQLVGGGFRQWPATVGGDSPANALGPQWKPFLFPVPNLPVSQLENLRVGFDLLGPGTVWVDDVQLSELAFTDEEQIELRKIIARSDFQLRSKRYSDCARSLNTYWLRFLREYVPKVDTSDQEMADVRPSPPPEAPRSRPQPAEKTSVLDRVKRFIPRLPRF